MLTVQVPSVAVLDRVQEQSMPAHASTDQFRWTTQMLAAQWAFIPPEIEAAHRIFENFRWVGRLAVRSSLMPPGVEVACRVSEAFCEVAQPFRLPRSPSWMRSERRPEDLVLRLRPLDVVDAIIGAVRSLSQDEGASRAPPTLTLDIAKGKMFIRRKWRAFPEERIRFLLELRAKGILPRSSRVADGTLVENQYRWFLRKKDLAHILEPIRGKGIALSEYFKILGGDFVS